MAKLVSLAEALSTPELLIVHLSLLVVDMEKKSGECECCVQDITLQEAETIALSILKQVMEEKVPFSV